MSETPLESFVDTGSIVKYEGIPTEASLPQESSRWRRFLAAIWPFAREGGKWANYSAELSRTFAEAEVTERVNRSKRTAAEAADIAASADLKRQQSVQVFNSEIDGIFAQDDLPEAAKILKLAKLLEVNPDLAAQVERVTDILDRLRLQNGTSVAFQFPQTNSKRIG